MDYFPASRPYTQNRPPALTWEQNSQIQQNAGPQDYRRLTTRPLTDGNTSDHLPPLPPLTKIKRNVSLVSDQNQNYQPCNLYQNTRPLDHSYPVGPSILQRESWETQSHMEVPPKDNSWPERIVSGQGGSTIHHLPRERWQQFKHGDYNTTHQPHDMDAYQHQHHRPQKARQYFDQQLRYSWKRCPQSETGNWISSSDPRTVEGKHRPISHRQLPSREPEHFVPEPHDMDAYQHHRPQNVRQYFDQQSRYSWKRCSQSKNETCISSSDSRTVEVMDRPISHRQPPSRELEHFIPGPHDMNAYHHQHHRPQNARQYFDQQSRYSWKRCSQSENETCISSSDSRTVEGMHRPISHSQLSSVEPGHFVMESRRRLQCNNNKQIQVIEERTAIKVSMNDCYPYQSQMQSEEYSVSLLNNNARNNERKCLESSQYVREMRCVDMGRNSKSLDIVDDDSCTIIEPVYQKSQPSSQYVRETKFVNNLERNSKSLEIVDDDSCTIIDPVYQRSQPLDSREYLKSSRYVSETKCVDSPQRNSKSLEIVGDDSCTIIEPVYQRSQPLDSRECLKSSRYVNEIKCVNNPERNGKSLDIVDDDSCTIIEPVYLNPLDSKEKVASLPVTETSYPTKHCIEIASDPLDARNQCLGQGTLWPREHGKNVTNQPVETAIEHNTQQSLRPIGNDSENIIDTVVAIMKQIIAQESLDTQEQNSETTKSPPVVSVNHIPAQETFQTSVQDSENVTNPVQKTLYPQTQYTEKVTNSQMASVDQIPTQETLDLRTHTNEHERNPSEVTGSKIQYSGKVANRPEGTVRQNPTQETLDLRTQSNEHERNPSEVTGSKIQYSGKVANRPEGTASQNPTQETLYPRIQNNTWSENVTTPQMASTQETLDPKPQASEQTTNPSEVTVNKMQGNEKVAIRPVVTVSQIPPPETLQRRKQYTENEASPQMASVDITPIQEKIDPRTQAYEYATNPLEVAVTKIPGSKKVAIRPVVTVSRIPAPETLQRRIKHTEHEASPIQEKIDPRIQAYEYATNPLEVPVNKITGSDKVTNRPLVTVSMIPAPETLQRIQDTENVTTQMTSVDLISTQETLDPRPQASKHATNLSKVTVNKIPGSKKVAVRPVVTVSRIPAPETLQRRIQHTEHGASPQMALVDVIPIQEKIDPRIQGYEYATNPSEVAVNKITGSDKVANRPVVTVSKIPSQETLYPRIQDTENVTTQITSVDLVSTRETLNPSTQVYGHATNLPGVTTNKIQDCEKVANRPLMTPAQKKLYPRISYTENVTTPQMASADKIPTQKAINPRIEASEHARKPSEVTVNKIQDSEKVADRPVVTVDQNQNVTNSQMTTVNQIPSQETLNLQAQANEHATNPLELTVNKIQGSEKVADSSVVTVNQTQVQETIHPRKQYREKVIRPQMSVNSTRTQETLIPIGQTNENLTNLSKVTVNQTEETSGPGVQDNEKATNPEMMSVNQTAAQETLSPRMTNTPVKQTSEETFHPGEQVDNSQEEKIIIRGSPKRKPYDSIGSLLFVSPYYKIKCYVCCQEAVGKNVGKHLLFLHLKCRYCPILITTCREYRYLKEGRVVFGCVEGRRAHDFDHWGSMPLDYMHNRFRQLEEKRNPNNKSLDERVIKNMGKYITRLLFLDFNDPWKGAIKHFRNYIKKMKLRISEDNAREPQPSTDGSEAEKHSKTLEEQNCKDRDRPKGRERKKLSLSKDKTKEPSRRYAKNRKTEQSKPDVSGRREKDDCQRTVERKSKRDNRNNTNSHKSSEVKKQRNEKHYEHSGKNGMEIINDIALAGKGSDSVKKSQKFEEKSKRKSLPRPDAKKATDKIGSKEKNKEKAKRKTKGDAQGLEPKIRRQTDYIKKREEERNKLKVNSKENQKDFKHSNKIKRKVQQITFVQGGHLDTTLHTKDSEETESCRLEMEDMQTTTTKDGFLLSQPYDLDMLDKTTTYINVEEAIEASKEKNNDVLERSTKNRRKSEAENREPNSCKRSRDDKKSGRSKERKLEVLKTQANNSTAEVNKETKVETGNSKRGKKKSIDSKKTNSDKKTTRSTKVVKERRKSSPKSNRDDKVVLDTSKSDKKRTTDSKECDKKRTTDCKEFDQKRTTDCKECDPKRTTDSKEYDKKRTMDCKECDQKRTTDSKECDQKRATDPKECDKKRTACTNVLLDAQKCGEKRSNDSQNPESDRKRTKTSEIVSEAHKVDKKRTNANPKNHRRIKDVKDAKEEEENVVNNSQVPNDYFLICHYTQMPSECTMCYQELLPDKTQWYFSYEDLRVHVECPGCKLDIRADFSGDHEKSKNDTNIVCKPKCKKKLTFET